MQKITLKSEIRKSFGRKTKDLRRKGLIPGNIFGRKVESTAIQINNKEFEKIFDEAGETGVVEITLGNEKRPVLIHNVQVDPVNEKILHVDFLQVDLKQKVTAEVPIELVGEAPAVKQSLGTVVQYINEVEVEALPGDLPDKFEVDINNLAEVDQVVYVKDLKIDKTKVEIKEDGDAIVVKVESQKEEKIEELISVTEEVPAEGESGAEKAEGQSEPPKNKEEDK